MIDHILNNREQEFLQILTKECEEVIQACSKIIRFPEHAENNVVNLHYKLADVLGVLKLMFQEEILNADLIQTNAEAKIKKLNAIMKNKK